MKTIPQRVARRYIESMLPEDQGAFTPKELSQVLRCSLRQVHYLLEHGELAAVQRHRGRSGSKVLIPRGSVEDYLHRSML
jgi:excisionase family DNA binding protein